MAGKGKEARPSAAASGHGFAVEAPNATGIVGHSAGNLFGTTPFTPHIQGSVIHGSGASEASSVRARGNGRR